MYDLTRGGADTELLKSVFSLAMISSTFGGDSKIDASGACWSLSTDTLPSLTDFGNCCGEFLS